MSVSFDSSARLIIVPVRVSGPRGDSRLRFAVDTGATSTVVNSDILASLGYDLPNETEYSSITTGSGIERAARFPVQRLEAIGARRREFPVLAFNLPPTAMLDGLLGLDFLRGSRLTVDFRKGRIILT